MGTATARCDFRNMTITKRGEAMPTWQQIEKPLYAVAGLALIFATAFGLVNPGIALPTFGTGLLLCGITVGRFADGLIKSKREDAEP